jgi:hypothetical protein
LDHPEERGTITRRNGERWDDGKSIVPKMMECWNGRWNDGFVVVVSRNDGMDAGTLERWNDGMIIIVVVVVVVVEKLGEYSREFAWSSISDSTIHYMVIEYYSFIHSTICTFFLFHFDGQRTLCIYLIYDTNSVPSGECSQDRSNVTAGCST